MPNPVTQFQILSKDPESAARFYTSLFDWKIDANNALGYRRIDTGSTKGISGGIWPAPPDAHDFVQLFIEVDDCAQHAAKARELGARVIVPPQKLPEGDELAILLDPEGRPFGIVKPR